MWARRTWPASSRPWRELGGVDPSVVGHGVVKVVEQVLEGSLAGDDGLDEEAEHREHGKAAVLISLTLSSAKVTGSSARPRGSKYWPPG
jgi:hypothetical protein